MPLTNQTISLVESCTFRLLPFQVEEFARMLSISYCRRCRKLNAVLAYSSLDSLVSWAVGEMSGALGVSVPPVSPSRVWALTWREGTTMTNDNSVSRCAERELRFVDPKRVKIGSDLGDGESQMPGPM